MNIEIIDMYILLDTTPLVHSMMITAISDCGNAVTPAFIILLQE